MSRFSRVIRIICLVFAAALASVAAMAAPASAHVTPNSAYTCVGGANGNCLNVEGSGLTVNSVEAFAASDAPCGLSVLIIFTYPNGSTGTYPTWNTDYPCVKNAYGPWNTTWPNNTVVCAQWLNSDGSQFGGVPCVKIHT